MWGAAGTLLGDSAYVWLVMSSMVEKIPLSVTREAKAELARIMEDYNEIAITVLPDDLAAVRFASCGWAFADRDNDDGSLTRKQLTDAILADPKYRIPIGDHYAIRMVYRPGSVH